MVPEGEHTQRGLYVGGRWVWIVAGTVAIALWIWGVSGSVGMMLNEWGAMPEWLRPFTHPRGTSAVGRDIALFAAPVATITFFALHRSRRWVTVPIAVLAPLLVWAALDHLPGRSVQNRFDLLLPDLERITVLPVVADNPRPGYYESLPPDLAYASVDGLISPDGRGGVFVPQWAGMPDDAGGFIYWPHDGAPTWDMWGMACTDPLHLEGEWWACGLRDEW